MGSVFGIAAVVGAVLGLTKGSTAVASSASVLGPLSGIANLVDLSGLVVVDIGFGIWVSVIGGVVAAIAGVVAYRQSMR